MKTALLTMLRQVLVPNGVLVIAGMALSYWGLGFAPSTGYLVAVAISAMGVLLAWRFHNPRPLLALLLLALVDTTFLVAPAAAAVTGIASLLAFLLPLNIAVLLLVDASSFDLEAFGWWAGLIVFQTVIVIAIYRADAITVLSWLSAPVVSSLSWPITLPQIAVLLFAVVGLLLLLKLLISRTAVDSGLFWSTCTCFLALNAGEQRFTAAYFAIAGLILGISVIETSYQVAYHDELTGLPGRRAFNRAIGALGEEYSIAMADIDHFKRFNDTFGHDVGDQVLRMVASKLAKVGGDGRAFRCGGEEFAIVFPSTAREAFDHAEELRQIIEQAPFLVRGPDRSQRRRKERRYRQAKRSLRPAPLTTSVTVSIGVAEPSTTILSPEAVIQAADQALYQAKGSGRNRVELYQRRRANAVDARI